MAEEKKQGFLKGAAILSIATIVVKVVGLAFTFPLANKIGDQAMGYYGVAYELFAFFNAAATAGLPVAVSRMVSRAYTLGRKKQADRIFFIAMTSFCVLGLICTITMYIFSDQFAVFLESPNASYCIKALAPTVFFCTLMSAIRGYFQGRSNMMPTAISQVIEALTKLIIGLALAFYVYDTTDGNGALSAAAAIVGVSISAGLGALFSIACKMHQKIKDRRLQAPKGENLELIDSKLEIFKSLYKLAIPITIGACFTNLLNVIDTKTINGALKSIEAFSINQAEGLYGAWIKTGKLYDLPGAIIIPLATSVLPVLTAAFTKNDTKSVSRTASSVLRMTFLIAIPCCVGFILFGGPIASVFYKESVAVGQLLQIVALSVIFNGLLYTTNAIMQSMGNVIRPVVHMCIGGGIKIGLNYILVSNAALNIYGVPISTVASNLVVAILNLYVVYHLVPKMEGLASIVIPIIPAALVMGGGSYLVYFGLSKVAPAIISLAAAIIAAVVIYLAAAVFFKAISITEIRMLPRGDRLAKMLHMEEKGKHYK